VDAVQLLPGEHVQTKAAAGQAAGIWVASGHKDLLSFLFGPGRFQEEYLLKTFGLIEGYFGNKAIFV
jgi:hypothetical protein